MNRKQIRLNENQLNEIVKESVIRLLNEQYGVDFEDTLNWVKRKKPDMSSQEQEMFARNIIKRKCAAENIAGKYKWAFSIEWNENTPRLKGFPKYKLHLYPHVTLDRLEQIKSDAYNYSPYDYLDFEEYNNENEFIEKVDYLVSKGAIVE